MSKDTKFFYFPATAQHAPKDGDKRLALIFGHDSGKIVPKMQSFVYRVFEDKSHSWWCPDAEAIIDPHFLFDVLEELISIEHKNGSRR